MSSHPQLEGEILTEQEAELSRRLRDAENRITALQQELRDGARDFDDWRKATGPFFAAMRHVFGKMDGTEVPGAPSVSSSQASGVWESWKKKLGGKKAEFIQAMQDHGHPMTAEQLRVTTHTGKTNVPQIIYELNKLGLIDKRDGRYSLKEL